MTVMNLHPATSQLPEFAMNNYIRATMAFNPDLFTIRQARDLLARFLPVTRMVPAPSLSRPGSPVYLKLETDLPTSSFKPRGAIYALATNLSRRQIAEVTASSTGNHGAAVAYAAQLLGLPATIFLSANPNAVKRDKIRELGARIVESGAADLAEAAQLIVKHRHRKRLPSTAAAAYSSRVVGMARFFNCGIERVLYDWPIRKKIGPLNAGDVYTIPAWLMNLFYSRLAPRGIVCTGLFGCMLTGLRSAAAAFCWLCRQRSFSKAVPECIAC